MKNQAGTFAITSPGAGRPTVWRRRAGWILLCAVALAPASDGMAQEVFPSGATQVFYDDMEAYTNMSQTITWTTAYPYWQLIHGYSGFSDSRFYVEDPAPTRTANGVWGVKHLGNLYGYKADSSLMIIRDSIPPLGPDGAQNTNAVAYDPADWTNIRFEMDVQTQQLMVPGMIWAMTLEDDTAYPPENKGPADGYIFYLESENANGFPNVSGCTNTYPDSEVKWHLARIQGFDRTKSISGQKDWIQLASDYVRTKIPGTDTLATVADGTLDLDDVQCLTTVNVYRFRLDVFCGNVRVQYLMVDGDTGTHPDDTVYRGCNADGNTACTSANIDDCWCEMFQGPFSGFDESPIEGPGMVGFYRGGIWTMGSPYFDVKFDNVKVSSFAGECSQTQVCDPWLENWFHVQTDTVPFKFLYEGALFDYSAGRNITPAFEQGKIDIATEAPATVSSYNHALYDPVYSGPNPYCNGWKLLQGLPEPTVTGGNIGDILTFLEPMHSAVVYDHSRIVVRRQLRRRPGKPRLQPGAHRHRRLDAHQLVVARGLRLVQGTGDHRRLGIRPLRKLPRVVRHPHHRR